MTVVLVSGVQFDAARNVRVSLRTEGSDAAFEVTLDASVDPVLFGRPSYVEIYAMFGTDLLRVFDGFIAGTEDRQTTALVQCVDGKKFLEGSMLESDYSGNQSLAAHAEDVIDTALALGYYAPMPDVDVSANANVSYKAGMHLRGVFDELFREHEWRVTGGVLEARSLVGTDRRESVLIDSRVALAETDMLAIANVIFGTSDAGTDVQRDPVSVLTQGYARGAVERVDGKTGSAFTAHVQSVLAQRKGVRPVWGLQRSLPELVFLEAGDRVSVDIPSTVLNEAPTELRVSEVTYDFLAGTEVVVLSTDAKRSKANPQRLKELEEKVRVLQL